MERAISAPSCLGRSARVRSLAASSPVPSPPPRSWRIKGHLRRSSASMGEVYANTMNDRDRKRMEDVRGELAYRQAGIAHLRSVPQARRLALTQIQRAGVSENEDSTLR